MRHLSLSLALGLVFSTFSKAEVVYDNLATGTPAFVTFSGTTQYAQQFTTNTSFSGFESLKLNLFKSTSGATGVFSVYLTDDSGSNTPGSTSVSLVNGAFVNTLDTSATSIWQLSNVSFSTKNAGKYWIKVVADNTELNWARGAQNLVGNPSATGTDNGASVTWTGGGNSLGGQIAVPEPGTLLLGTLAACSGGAGVWWKRRRRQPVPAETADQPATI